jgi:MFS transporter, FSR family, fosmidomycin resistance protein
VKNKTFKTADVILISVVHFVHDVYSSFLAPILPLLIEKLGMSYAAVGTLSVIQRIPSLLNPFIGIIADKTSVRYFLIIAPAITTIVMSLIGVAPNVFVLGLLLFIMGFSATLFHVPGPVIIKNISGSKIGRGMSFYMLGGELARTVGPMFILGGISLWGLEGSYRLVPFGLIASLILFFRFRKMPVYSVPSQNKKKSTGIPRDLLRFFLVLLAITFFRSIMKSAFTTFLPTFMSERGASLWISGASLSILQFSGAIGTFAAGPISDKIGRRTSLLIIASITPVLMWLFVSSSGMWSFVVLTIMGLFLFANGPVLLALVQEIGVDRPAFSNGIYMTMSFFISSLAALVIGIMGDHFGLTISFKVAAIMALGGIPFVMLLPGKK